MIPDPALPSDPPFVKITLKEGTEIIDTNLPPEGKPMILWLLERARLIILTQPSMQEKSSIVKANGFAGIRKRVMGR